MKTRLNKPKWGIGSLSFAVWILGFLICTIQTKALSQLSNFLKMFSKIRSLLGIGLIIFSHILAKNYPNHKLSLVSKKCAIGLYFIHK